MTHSARSPVSRAWTAALLGLVVVGTAGCRESIDYNDGRIDFEPDRPEVPDSEDITPYDGDDETVLEAQKRFGLRGAEHRAAG